MTTEKIKEVLEVAHRSGSCIYIRWKKEDKVYPLWDGAKIVEMTNTHVTLSPPPCELLDPSEYWKLRRKEMVAIDDIVHCSQT